MTRGQTAHCAAEVLAGVHLVIPVGGEEVLSEVENCKASGGCDRDEKNGWNHGEDDDEVVFDEHQCCSLSQSTREKNVRVVRLW